MTGACALDADSMDHQQSLQRQARRALLEHGHQQAHASSCHAIPGVGGDTAKHCARGNLDVFHTPHAHAQAFATTVVRGMVC